MITCVRLFWIIFLFLDLCNRSHKILWQHDFIEYSGTPFIILNKKIYDCHYGKDRSLPGKMRRLASVWVHFFHSIFSIKKVLYAAEIISYKPYFYTRILCVHTKIQTNFDWQRNMVAQYSWLCWRLQFFLILRLRFSKKCFWYSIILFCFIIETNKIITSSRQKRSFFCLQKFLSQKLYLFEKFFFHEINRQMINH